jgi:hypothetical protein
MKRSEVVAKLLSAYYFQEGKRADSRVTKKADIMIEQFKKYEAEETREEALKASLK